MCDELQNIILLSYPIVQNTPRYGMAARGFEVRHDNCIVDGEGFNTFTVFLDNHFGTHIDCPNHFHADGKKVSDYTLEDLTFHHPQVLKVTLEDDELLKTGKIAGKVGQDTDLLIFWSGWGDFRNDDKYSMSNPGVDTEVAEYLHENFPNVRAIGIDFISISSEKHKEIGVAAHKAFMRAPNEILIIEDMNITGEVAEKVARGAQIAVLPIICESVDSTPCQVVLL